MISDWVGIVILGVVALWFIIGGLSIGRHGPLGVAVLLDSWPAVLAYLMLLTAGIAAFFFGFSVIGWIVVAAALLLLVVD